MKEFNGVKYYTTYEISGFLKNENFWPYGNCRSDVQNVLDKARKAGVIEYLKYQTQDVGGRTRYLYSMNAIKEFAARNIPLNEFSGTGGFFRPEVVLPHR